MSIFHRDSPGITLVRGDQAELVGTPAVMTRLLVDSDQTDGAVSANRAVLGAGSDGPPPHYHAGSSEMFFVLDGTLQALVGDRIVELEKGDVLVVPKNTPHAFGASAGVHADVLVIFAPGMTKRFEYFRLVDRVLKGRSSPQEILDTQERFDNHFVDSAAWREARAKTEER
jgi:mannose-6-phosphate isomerase-like protein (cupin superfamily)